MNYKMLLGAAEELLVPIEKYAKKNDLPVEFVLAVMRDEAEGGDAHVKAFVQDNQSNLPKARSPRWLKVAIAMLSAKQHES